jgi:hypothetical protein
LTIKDLFSRFNPCVQLEFQPIRISAARYLTFNYESAIYSEPTSAPLIGDYRLSTSHGALTFPEPHQGKTIARQIKGGELIVASSDSVRKRLRLLALAPTMPFTC